MTFGKIVMIPANRLMSAAALVTDPPWNWGTPVRLRPEPRTADMAAVVEAELSSVVRG